MLAGERLLQAWSTLQLALGVPVRRPACHLPCGHPLSPRDFLFALVTAHTPGVKCTNPNRWLHDFLRCVHPDQERAFPSL